MDVTWRKAAFKLLSVFGYSKTRVKTNEKEDSTDASTVDLCVLIQKVIDKKISARANTEVAPTLTNRWYFVEEIAKVRKSRLQIDET